MTLSLEEAMHQQLGHWRATLDSGANRLGWKIGFNSPELQEKLGIDHSVVGNLTTATLLGADGSHSLAGAEKALVEPEIAIEMGPEGSIAGLAVAAEVIDMPAPPAPEEVGEVVAANIFHRAVAIGSSRRIDSADGVEAVLSVNGEVQQRGDAGATDLLATIALVFGVLEEAGERLEAGDRIIAGTLAPPAPVQPGDTAAVDLGPLGSLDLSFTH